MGIGIGLVDDKELIVHPEVTVHSDEIGGPSAGFMFSLEIYNQLTKEDLTKGYKIAGTGTISSDGTVGKMVGLSKKLWQQIKPEQKYSLHRMKMVKRIQIITMRF